jgi:hypothetical protein
MVTCAAREGHQAQNTLESVVRFYENHFPDLPLTDEKIEILI